MNTTAKYFPACIGNLYINTSIPQGNKNTAHSSGIRGYLQSNWRAENQILFIYAFIILRSSNTFSIKHNPKSKPNRSQYSI